MTLIAAEKIYPVQWSEGMLLSPQHFQQNDRYWEQYIHTKTLMVNPYSWGVNYLKIDESALAAGELSVEKLDAILPDGLIVKYLASKSDKATNDDIKLNVSLKNAIDPDKGEKSVMVYLIVPIRAEGAACINSPIQRFDSVNGDEVADENTGDGKVAIGLLRPKISLTIEKPHPKYSSLPLCKIEIGSDGAYSLANYVPPMLRLSALHELKGLCLQYKLKALLVKIRQKANQLSGSNSDKEEIRGAMISEQHARVIKHMVSSLPLLEIICASGVSHPFDVYKSLAALIGQISSIGTGSPVPPLLPEYRHEDIYRAFTKSLSFVDKVVEDISLSYSSVNFSEQEDGTFSILVDKAWLSKELFIDVVFRKDQSRDDVIQWVTKSRVGSNSVLKILTDRRMVGAQLTNIKRDEESGLEEKSNVLLFSLKNVALEKKDPNTMVIKPGQKLYIKGDASSSAPLAVTLHISNKACSL